MKSILITLLLLPSLCFAFDFDDILSAEIDYTEWTGRLEVSTWKISLNKNEIQSFRLYLFTAKRIKGEKLPWFIGRYDGLLNTKSGKYTIYMGKEKIAARTYRISMHPIGMPKGRTSLYFRMNRKRGNAFRNHLEAILAPKTKGIEPKVHKIKRNSIL